MRRLRRLMLACLLLPGAAVNAQQAELRVEQAPYYAGVPVKIQVVVESFEESPQPSVDVAPPSGARLELVGVSPSVSTSIRIINGEMSQSKTVRFVYQYRFLADAPGRFDIGPFRVTQGTVSAQTGRTRFDVQSVPKSGAQHIQLVLPDTPLWVGQRVPVRIEWWVSEALADNVSGHRARVPLFERVDLFKFEDQTEPSANNRLLVESASGTEELPATVRRAVRDGEPYLVVAVSRSMVALKSFELELPPAAIVTDEVIRWQRDLFGQRVPARTRSIRAEDEPRLLVARAPPLAGRPASFAGAVGKGFTIAASADRSVVQTGDPIELTLSVRGDAALETVSLPNLAASGLDATLFRVSEVSPGGAIEAGSKRFGVTVRVLDASVREIPAIAFSWFDPQRGVYETTHTRPIALSVRAAEVVTATDVERASAVQDEMQDTEQIDEAADAPGAGVTSIQDLGGADLAIETDVASLLAATDHWLTRPATQVAAYLLGITMVATAWWAKRRADEDPAALVSRKALSAERKRLEQAATIGDVADAIRRMAAIAGAFPRADHDRLLSEFDERIFGPGRGAAAPVESSLRARALSVADTMLEASR